MVPMRDGVKLATDIYLPDNLDAPVPVILHRTPYDKSRKGAVEAAEFFTAHGYAVVFQDCRGRYQSEGIFTKYLNEPEDSYDSVEWVGTQPWSNGKVGMRGGSYLGHVQAGAAKLNPPHLSTIVVTVGGTSNGWNHAIRNHGALALKQLTWAFSNLRSETDDPVVKAHMRNESIGDWFQALPWKRGNNPLSVSPEFESYVFEIWEHPNYDAFWKQMGLNWAEYYEQTSDIPMVHISGWYDNYCQTAIDNYLGLSRLKKSPIHLLLGPWTHSVATSSHAGDVEFGEVAKIPDFYNEWHLRWYDEFLKGQDRGIAGSAPVSLFVMGSSDGHKDAEGRLFHGGYWIQGSEWPLPETMFTPFYLHPSGKLSTKVPSPDAASASYVFDPANPVPTIGGSMAASQPIWTGGAFDQRERLYEGDPETGFYGSKAPYLPLAARSDILVYQTEPLAEDMLVVGPIEVMLHVSSDRPDTDFTAKLIDVYPPSEDFPGGFAMNLTDGILRARYRNSPEKPEWMEAGKVYKLTIRPFGTANLFKKGHRIRLNISSSNFPRFDVNPNTGDQPGMEQVMLKALNTVHQSKETPSILLLPLVPVSAYPVPNEPNQ